MSERLSPLHAEHLAAGAKLLEFGGFLMPLSYLSGTLAEHHACRSAAAMFDVSHLGSVRVIGPDALAALQWTLSNDLLRIAPGRAQYSHLLDADDGSVLDDVIVWWVDSEHFEVMPNASNTGRVLDSLRAGPGRPDIRDVTADRALIAIQGPTARNRLAELAPTPAAVGRFRVARADLAGVEVLVAGTGYTGEDGVEIALPICHAGRVWQALKDAGVAPAGLAARDTLRLEAGLPLHGHELGRGITPLQAGLGWVVCFEKGDFRGRRALLDELEHGPHRVIRGMVMEGRRPARQGCIVRRDGRDIGVVTSGNFSPVLGRGIALAFVPPDLVAGDEVGIDIRGTAAAAVLTDPPFHR